MKWEGTKIKEKAKANNISLSQLAELIGVSRQSINDWMKGQVPKGVHLIALCQTLHATPDYFFNAEDGADIILSPLHRKRRTAKITDSMQVAAMKLVKEYSSIFKNETEGTFVPVVRVNERDRKNAIKIATRLRAISGIRDCDPIDYEHTFKLMADLGINVIFRYFPETIKSYAFYTRIYNHRVIFLNNSTNVIDLIFPLLHEIVHAIRDENKIINRYDDLEEEFCDGVANHVQFPEEYIEFVYDIINGLHEGAQVNKLKYFASKHGHALHGIVKAIRSKHPEFDLQVGGADTVLKRKFNPIGKYLFGSEDQREFIHIYSILSPNFINIIKKQADSISTRTLGDLLGLENYLDAKLIKEELLR